MISRGLQIAANGMLGLIENQDAIAHNLANVNTAGYKKEALIFKNVYNSIVSEPQNRADYKYRNHHDVGMLSMGSQSHKLVHEFLQGTLSRTDRPLDVAIQGDGFFKVQGPDGSVAYTRNGNFVINSQNLLTDNDGNLVMDRENRPIQLNIRALGITTPKEITINGNGQMCIVRGEGAGTQVLQSIGVWDFSNKEDMKSLGSARYYPKDITTNPELVAEKYTVEQGAVELSNTNVVNEMINTISTTRNYETLSKFVKEKSSLMQTAINIGRLKS